MQKKRTATILASVLLVVALLASLAVATYALFSDSTRVGNRLEAGTLDIALYRTSLTYTDYTAEGGETTDDEELDLSDADNQVFKTENFFPGMKQTATLELRNKGSLPFTYNITFTISEGEGEEGTAAADEDQPTLADYILVTVTRGETQCGSKTLAELAAGEAIEIGSMNGTADEKQSFDVTIEFVDEEADNSMQGASIDFDILVTATQNTSAPATDGATE